MSREWYDPVKPIFLEAGNILHFFADSQAPLVMLHTSERDNALWEDGKVCSNCAYRMPDRPCKATLHQFEPVSEHKYPYDDATVRDLIRSEQCPVCRAPCLPDVVARMKVLDHWTRDGIEKNGAK